MLPAEGFVRLKTVLEVIPVSRSTWYLGVAEKKFPAPVKFSRCSLWRVSDIRQLIAELGEDT